MESVSNLENRLFPLIIPPNLPFCQLTSSGYAPQSRPAHLLPTKKNMHSYIIPKSRAVIGCSGKEDSQFKVLALGSLSPRNRRCYM